MPQKPHRRDESPSLGVEDAIHQRAVLTFILSHHPTRFSQGELARLLAVDPEDGAQRDAVIRAVGALAATGLLRRDGYFVVPTRAAVYFDSLSSRA